MLRCVQHNSQERVGARCLWGDAQLKHEPEGVPVSAQVTHSYHPLVMRTSAHVAMIHSIKRASLEVHLLGLDESSQVGGQQRDAALGRAAFGPMAGCGQHHSRFMPMYTASTLLLAPHPTTREATVPQRGAKPGCLLCQPLPLFIIDGHMQAQRPGSGWIVLCTWTVT